MTSCAGLAQLASGSFHPSAPELTHRQNVCICVELGSAYPGAAVVHACHLMPINPLFPRSQVGEFLAARPSRPPHPSSSPPALLSLLPPRDTHRSPKLANSLSTTEKLPLGIYRTPSVPDFLIGRSCKHTAPSASRPSPRSKFSNQPTIPRSSPSSSVPSNSLFFHLRPPLLVSCRTLHYKCHVASPFHHIMPPFIFFVKYFLRRPRAMVDRAKWIAQPPKKFQHPLSPNTTLVMR